MTPREIESANRKVMLKDFIKANYQFYNGVLIFKPVSAVTNFLEAEFMHDANTLWLIKNNIDVEMTL